jgi:NAD dependent epimerase/dehydratase family enzyme
VAPRQTNIMSFFGELNHFKKVVLKIKINENIVKLLLGESAITIIEGQIVLPSKLEQAGFHFTFQDINSTLRSLLI